NRAHPALRRMNRRVSVGWHRPLDVDSRMQRNAERDFLFRAPETRMAETDWPRAVHFAEMLQRTIRVRDGTLASELVEAVPEAMPFVAVLLGEPAGIEVRAPRTLLVNGLPVGEHRPVLRVECRQRAVGRVLQYRPEQVVGVGRAA